MIAIALFTILGSLAGLFIIAGYLATSDGRFVPKQEFPESYFTSMGLMLAIVLIIAGMSLMWILIKSGFPVRILLLIIFFNVFFQGSKDILRTLKYRSLLAWFLSISVSVAWFVFPSWITSDLAALFLILIMLSVFKKISVPWAFTLNAIIVPFDVGTVFLTSLPQNIAVAIGTSPGTPTLPIAFGFTGVEMIGLPDIFFPGLAIVAAFHEGKKRGIFYLPYGAIIGYLIALVCGILVLNVFHTDQPIMLYLVPGVFIGYGVSLLLSRKIMRKGTAI